MFVLKYKKYQLDIDIDGQLQKSIAIARFLFSDAREHLNNNTAIVVL